MEVNMERFVDGEFFGDADVDFELVISPPVMDVNIDGVARLSINKFDFFPKLPLVGLLGELCAKPEYGLPVAVRYFELEEVPIPFLGWSPPPSPPIPLPTLLIDDLREGSSSKEL